MENIGLTSVHKQANIVLKTHLFWNNKFSLDCFSYSWFLLIKAWKYELNIASIFQMTDYAIGLELVTLVCLLGQFLVLFQFHLLCTYIFVKLMTVKPQCILERHPLTFCKRIDIFHFLIFLQLKNNQYILLCTSFVFWSSLSYTAASADYLGRVKVTNDNVVALWNVFKYLNYNDDFVKHVQPCRY